MRPLRRLTHKNASGSELKRFKAPIVKYFSESDLKEHQGDASKDKLSFLLMEHGQPVTSRSGALPLAVRKCSKIEKEFFCPGPWYTA